VTSRKDPVGGGVRRKWYPPESHPAPLTGRRHRGRRRRAPALSTGCSVRSCRSRNRPAARPDGHRPGRRAQLDHLEHRPLHLDQGWRWLEGSHERRQARGGGAPCSDRVPRRADAGDGRLRTKLPERSARSRCAPIAPTWCTGTLLAGTADVELAIAFQQSFGAGLFGGPASSPARFRQRHAWIELSGELVEYHLAAGETCASTLATWACSTKASTSRSCRSGHQEHGVRRRQHLSRGAHRAGTCGCSPCRCPTWHTLSSPTSKAATRTRRTRAPASSPCSRADPTPRAERRWGHVMSPARATSRAAHEGTVMGVPGIWNGESPQWRMRCWKTKADTLMQLARSS